MQWYFSVLYPLLLPLSFTHAQLSLPVDKHGGPQMVVDPSMRKKIFEMSPLNCPMDDFWPDAYFQVERSVQLFQEKQYQASKEMLIDIISRATADLKRAFQCSLGVSSMYRALAFTYCGGDSNQNERRLYQICLRMMHLSMNWITHYFVSTKHEVSLIDDSIWPMSIKDINVDLNRISRWLENSAQGNQGRSHQGNFRNPHIPRTFRHPRTSIHIVSLCAYPPEHVLPGYAVSNHELYAKKHGYKYSVAMERVAEERPHAWGKIKLMADYIRKNESDWYMWFDCDTYFMNMTVTLDSVLYEYGGVQTASGDWELDENFHMLVQEDDAMLNTGVFFLKSTPWSLKLLEDCYGSDDSVWIKHPWWENASFGWLFLKDLPMRYYAADSWREYKDDMENIYPPEVRVAAQEVFNSYHPITSRFLHDTWEPGKFVLAFSGVLSGSSPTIIEMLYGNYYKLACELNGFEDQCIPVKETLPWRKHLND